MNRVVFKIEQTYYFTWIELPPDPQQKSAIVSNCLNLFAMYKAKFSGQTENHDS